MVREIDTEGAPGAPFPPGAGVQLQLGADGRAALGWAKGGRTLPDATNLSFERDASGAQRVYAIDPRVGELLVLRASERVVATETRRIRELVGVDAAGIAVDAAGDRLFVLEASSGRIVVIDGLLRSVRRRVSEIALPANPPPLRGLAFDPTTGHLHALAPATGELLELGPDGTLLAVRQFPEDARHVRAIAFGPSTDATDDPSVQHLFAAAPNESGGTTLELAADQLVLAAAPSVTATLVQTVLTSNFTPPSPDPSGIELLGPNGPLLISDGEVDEMSIYRGVNLWTVNLSGTVVSTADTFFSREPTGAAVNPANGHVFFSDDDGHAVYEVTLGSDGKVSQGDTVRKINVDRYGPIDCEGVAFGGGALWIAAGSDAEVYRILPGPNGTFDGGGDDVVSHFDTNAPGLTDAEGIAYDTDGGNVYVAGPAQDNLIAHFSATGTLLRWIDISAARAKNPAGLAYGPSPAGGTSRRLYLVARGTDNNTSSSENDGKLFVFSLNPLGGGSPSNVAPSVSAGNDLSVDLAASASLDGGVSDDGLPNGTLTTTWSMVSGPGTVSFANANAIDTTATFSATGSYVVRLTANDSQLSSFDEATITVTSSGGGGTTTIDKRVAASADDAEQASSGLVDTGSSDLELVTDASVQTVGIRFSGLAIPPGAAIQSAWIQFQADEMQNEVTTLSIQGEASDNAVPFTTGTNNVSARPRTSAAVGWSPPAWNLVGEAGPAQQTPDLSNVIREIVSRGGWQSGNALAFVITGSGHRTAESFDGGSPPALLHVVFGGSPAGNVAPAVSAGPDRVISLGQTASLDGTVTDDAQVNPTPTTTWTPVSGPGSVGFADASAVDTTATFSLAGSYVLRLTAYDGEFTVQDEMTVSVTDPSVGGVVERRISAASDDAEERVVGGAVDLVSSDIELTADGTRNQWVGLRFVDLQIPAGAQIQNAWIQFQTDEVWTGPTSLTIQGEATANPVTFTSAAFDVSSRPRTADSVAWVPDPWNTVGEAGAPQTTPSLTPVVQALVGQADWAPGNAMVFVVSGSGTRTAESFDGGSPAALLHVEYGP